MAAGDTLHILSKRSVTFGDMPGRPPDFVVRRVARERWGPRFRAVRQSPNHVVVSIVSSGRGGFRAGDTTYQLSAGSVFMFGPGENHEFWTGPRHNLDVHITVMAGPGAIELVKRHLGSVSGVHRLDTVRDAEDISDRMLEVATRLPPYGQEICRSFAQALLLTIRSGLAERPPNGASGLDLYHSCKAYIDRHGAGMTSSGAAASACGVSHEHMCRLFRRYGNTTPHAYLLGLRSELASEMLMQSDRSIREIAQHLGFTDQYAFSRQFKRITGFSPSAWRGDRRPDRTQRD